MNKLFTKEIGLIFIISVVPVLAVYLPFLLDIKQFFFLDLKDSGVLQLVRNYDGPQFLVVAKSLYDKDIIKTLLFNGLDIKYFAAHFPLYPLFIRLITPIFGWFYSGLAITLLFGILTNFIFYQIAKKYTKHALFLTFVFTVFPARFWVVRSIVAPETLMLFTLLLSFWYWDQKKYVSSALLGAFAVLTKFQSLFLFPAYVATMFETWFKEKKFPTVSMYTIVLIPLSFVLLSYIYLLRFGDFFSFLHAESGNNLGIHIPFSQFNYKGTWTANSGWLEDIVFYFIAIMTLIVTLFKRKERVWFYFALFYGVFLTFLPHRDIARYSIQLVPIFLLTFEQFFTSKAFKYGLLLSLPALYFYTLNFIMYNQAPIADWGHFIK